jgi:integrase
MARPATGQVVERSSGRGTTYGIRFRAGGRRHYLTTSARCRSEAEAELANVLADVRRGIWQPPKHEVPAVAAPDENFHILATEWVDKRRHEVKQRTVDYWTLNLTCHLLPFFAEYDVSQITVNLVERFKLEKLRERERWEALKPEERKKLGLRKPLSNATINHCLKILAMILDYAIDRELIEKNVARGKTRRLKVQRPRRTWLEIEEVRAVLDVEVKHRALVATLILAGLRIGELIELTWRDVDLARGKLKIEDAKTDAGQRNIDITPDLLSC